MPNGYTIIPLEGPWNGSTLDEVSVLIVPLYQRSTGFSEVINRDHISSTTVLVTVCQSGTLGPLEALALRHMPAVSSE
jgi:hypothetical protein